VGRSVSSQDLYALILVRRMVRGEVLRRVLSEKAANWRGLFQRVRINSPTPQTPHTKNKLVRRAALLGNRSLCSGGGLKSQNEGSPIGYLGEETFGKVTKTDSPQETVGLSRQTR